MMPEWNPKRTLLLCRKAGILVWGLHSWSLPGQDEPDGFLLSGVEGIPGAYSIKMYLYKRLVNVVSIKRTFSVYKPFFLSVIRLLRTGEPAS